MQSHCVYVKLVSDYLAACHIAAMPCDHRLPFQSSLSGHAALAFSPSGMALKLKRNQPSAVCRFGRT